ncbi:hypothetical protein QJQ45_024463, partial [Haematococcus lacustris]
QESSIILCGTIYDKMWPRVNVAWSDLITGADWRRSGFIPDGVDPVLLLGALIAGFFALCANFKQKIAMGHPGPRRRALLERHKAIRAKLESSIILCGTIYDKMWPRVNVAWSDLITGADWRRSGFIPDGVDPVLLLGALIAGFFALCANFKQKIAMGHPGPQRRALLERHKAIRAKLESSIILCGTIYDKMWPRVNVAWSDLITGADWRRSGFIPDGVDPVLLLGALIAGFFALCANFKQKIAMGHPGPRRRALLERHKAVRAKLPSTGAQTQLAYSRAAQFHFAIDGSGNSSVTMRKARSGRRSRAAKRGSLLPLLLLLLLLGRLSSDEEFIAMGARREMSEEVVHRPPFPRTVNMVARCSLGLNGVPPYVGRRSKRKIPWVGSGPLMARALPDTWRETCLTFPPSKQSISLSESIFRDVAQESSIILCGTIYDKMWPRVNVAWSDLITGADWRRSGFIPDGVDPVLLLGALIAGFFALCANFKQKIAMGHPGPRRRALLERHKAIRAKLSPTELPALETALATPQQSSRGASTWGHKRPRTCLGRGAQQQLSMDQQQLQGAQHQLAQDQQQLQDAQHQLSLNQQELQGGRCVCAKPAEPESAGAAGEADLGTAAPPPRALGAAGEDGSGDTAHLLAADSPFVDPNAEFEHHHPDHHLPVPPPFVAASPTHLSATTVHGLYMCSCGPDAPHQARCCHRTCSDCKDKCMKLKPGVDGSIMLSVKQYAPVKQKEGPARIELQQFKLSLREVVDKLNEQMPSYIWHHFVAHHQLAVFRRQQQAVQEKGDHGRVVISCDWSERLTVERPTEIQSDHWHHHNVGIFVACAYFRNDRDEYREETVYILTDGKDQSAAVTQAALHQVLDYLQGERCMVMKQLCMWSDGCAAQFKGTPALQLHRRMAMRYKVPVWWSYGATSHFKGRHDSEGGVFKHSMAARVLADHPDLSAECKAQQLAGVHNVECVVPAAQLAASVAHQTRGSVQRRWCLVLKDEEVEKCAELDPDAHRMLRTITGSRAMHAMFFPADGVEPMWSETACACVRHMGSKPQQCMCHGASTLSSIPMFGRVTLASDKKEDAECLRLLHARAPHIASAHMTLNVHLLKEYARECLGWKGKRLTQKKPLLRADILEHLRWEQEMEEDQLAEVGVDEADEM